MHARPQTPAAVVRRTGAGARNGAEQAGFLEVAVAWGPLLRGFVVDGRGFVVDARQSGMQQSCRRHIWNRELIYDPPGKATPIYFDDAAP